MFYMGPLHFFFFCFTERDLYTSTYSMSLCYYYKLKLCYLRELELNDFWILMISFSTISFWNVIWRGARTPPSFAVAWYSVCSVCYSEQILNSAVFPFIVMEMGYIPNSKKSSSTTWSGRQATSFFVSWWCLGITLSDTLVSPWSVVCMATWQAMT